MAEANLSRPDRTVLGIGLIVASVLTMAFADAVVKLVSGHLTVWQVFVARSLVAIPALVALLAVAGDGLRLCAPVWTLIRAALLVMTWLAFYAALPVLSLSVAATAVYTNPIIIALLSAAVIGEPVTARQWLGVLLGFGGVLAILKPGTEAFSWFTLLPLAGAGLYALAMVLTRSKCQDEAPLMLALMLHVLFLVTGALATIGLALIGFEATTRATYPFLLGDWAPMDAEDWGLMVLIGVLSAAYFAGVARAYQIAPPSIIATFDYAYLVSAALWGFVFFTETPDSLTVLGMIMITFAGLLVAARPSARKA
ncbi:MAG: DMT family transporter [Pseudomonadota bacterium]